MKIKHHESEIKKVNVIDSYVNSLQKIVDIESINNSNLSIASDYQNYVSLKTERMDHICTQLKVKNFFAPHTILIR